MIRLLTAVLLLTYSLFGWSSVDPDNYQPCPGIQSGVLDGQNTKAVYGDCAIDGYSPEIYLYPALYFDVGLDTVGVQASPAVSLNPAPAGILKLGVFSAFGLANVGVNYAGNCEEVAATETSTAGQDGATYCGWYANGGTTSRLLLKATLTNGAFSDVTFAYNVPTATGDATPVSTLPLFGLGILASLLGLFGLRKLR
ncbi:hypothetical protein N9C62_09905 [Luminiphilus sp.]|nr:hypothetical protein [Luminiphilus sp.]